MAPPRGGFHRSWFWDYCPAASAPRVRGSGAPSNPYRSEERRVGKECRSLCDWSSDVCSSDLHGSSPRRFPPIVVLGLLPGRLRTTGTRIGGAEQSIQIGRASCRERV